MTKRVYKGSLLSQKIPSNQNMVNQTLLKEERLPVVNSRYKRLNVLQHPRTNELSSHHQDGKWYNYIHPMSDMEDWAIIVNHDNRFLTIKTDVLEKATSSKMNSSIIGVFA
ncbi:hypothetical protein MKL29_09280 [Streptococcus suis]|nr:hypothetical protein [Streptococcus suis]